MPSALKSRHLQVLLAVAGAGSMQRAAREIHLTQPAISKLIVELEEIFGAALFERSKRGVALTDCGAALVRRAQLVLNDLDQTKEEIAAIAAGTIGRVRVGILPVAEAGPLPSALRALHQTAPGLLVQIEDGTWPGLLGALRRGEVDCVIGRLDSEPADRDLNVEKLMPMPVRIVVRRLHPLARLKRTTWSDLAQQSWILPRAGVPLRAVIERQFAIAGLAPPRPAIESTSMRLIHAVIAGTDMVGTMTEDSAMAAVRSRELVILSVDLVGEVPHVGVVTRVPQVSSALGVFLTALREQCGKTH